MTKQETLQKLNQKLWTLTRKLVANMIPFNPPPKNTSIMEANNPKGYAMLLEFQATQLEYDTLKNSPDEDIPQDMGDTDNG